MMKITNCNIDQVVVTGFEYGTSEILMIKVVLLAGDTIVCESVRPAPFSEKIQLTIKELCQVLEQQLSDEIGQEQVKTRKLPRGISDQEI